MTLRQWTGDDGLISNNLTSVFQSNDQFIWVTSFNGILRFDGKSFKLYDKDNVDVMVTNAVYKIIQDPTQNHALMATQGSGVLRFEDGIFSRIPTLDVTSVRCIYKDSQERTWIGTNNEGLFLMTGAESVTRIDNGAFDNVLIMDIHEEGGFMWFGTGNGLVRFSDSFETVREFENKTVNTIHSLDPNTLLVGATDGLYLYDPAKMESNLIPEFTNVEINDMITESDRTILAATERGLFRANFDEDFYDVLNEQNGLPANQVSGVIIDHEQSVWLSTKKAGLIRLTRGSVTTMDQRDGISNTRVNSIYEHKGNIYVGSDNGLISVCEDGRTFHPLNLLTSVNEVGVRDFVRDEDGSLWIASYLGLLKYSNGRQRLYTTDQGLSSNMIRRVLKSSDGSLWLASRTGGVMNFRDPNNITVYDIESGLKSNYILAIEEDNNGKIVIGTHSGGLSIISDEGIENHMIPEIDGALIFNIHIDKDNHYWLSTNTGIFVFENGNFQKVQFRADFKTETFFDLVQDNLGNAWLTTNIGIIRVDYEDLIAFHAGQLEYVTPEIFDTSDGMKNRECTGATRSILMPNGELWVPTIDGIARINPANLQRNVEIPNVFITSFKVDGTESSTPDKRIAAGTIRYQFEFGATSYQAPDKVKFSYRLEGVDHDWIDAAMPMVEYTNLSPGQYTFWVRGSNNNELWNEEGAKLNFTVLPFYYQTWWFRILLLILAGVIIYFVFIWRLSHIRQINKELSKTNEELDRFVYSASHDLRAPLTSIMGLSQVARTSSSTEEKDQCLGMIEKSVLKLDEFIKDIIDFSRNQRIDVELGEVNVEEEAKSAFQTIEHLRNTEGIRFEIESKVDSIQTDYRRLQVIFKNIYANALLYHDDSKDDQWIKTTIEPSSRGTVIKIRDNGQGIEEEVIDSIFKMFYRGNTKSPGSGLGLYIVLENINKLGGSIRVNSEFGEWTEFSILLP